MYMDSHARDHPAMRITHFVGAVHVHGSDGHRRAPRPSSSTWIARAARRRSTTRSACTSIRTATSSTDAGITCITDQSTVYADGDTSGYTIKLGAYGRDDMGTLLEHAKQIFDAARARHAEDVPRRRLDRDARHAAGARTTMASSPIPARSTGQCIEEWKGKELYALDHGALGADRRHQPAVLSEPDRRPRAAARPRHARSSKSPITA